MTGPVIHDHTDGHVPGPGFYRMTAAAYHADPCEAPSLSSSVAAVMLEKSPAHAMLRHPRLSPQDEESDPTRPKEIGTAAHKLALGKGRDVVVIEADDYKGGAAKAARKAAYSAGHAPILRTDFATADKLARSIAARIADIPGCREFVSAEPELVAIAQDPTGAWLRVMMDRFEDHGDRAVVWDLKTGEQSAAPAGIGRRIANMGMEIQAAFYERAVLTLRPELAGRLTFRWLFAENEPPYCILPVELDHVGMAIGRKKVAAAIALWNRGIETGEWPAYPAGIATAEYPAWSEAAWTWRETEDPLLADLPHDPVLGRPVPSRNDALTELVP